MAEKLVGTNYVTPDIVAKVTGRARYAEDFRAEGMLFCKLLLSPQPHARVTRLDTRAALAMPGVRAILTADDLPDLGGAERALTNEPLYGGEPILAVAAVDEATAAEAIERIEIELEPLPFVDRSARQPASRRPRRAHRRQRVGSAAAPAAPGAPPPRPPIERLKWTEADFADAGEGRLPMGKAAEEWSFGDLDAGFAAADLVLDETFVVQSTGHHPMETRSAMAYWQNGKLYLHCSTQSVVRTVDGVARWVGIEPSQVVLISEYTGGGFGSKGAGSVSMAIPALLSKKAGAPVMMRISREEESYFGRARTSMVGRAKIGFARDGRITALDLFIVQDNGPYGPMGDHRSAGNAASLDLAAAARCAGGRSTCSPTRRRARSSARPGRCRPTASSSRSSRRPPSQLGLDQVAIRRINSPEGKAPLRPGRAERAAAPRHRRVREGGARSRRGAVRLERARGADPVNGAAAKVRGVGVAVGPHGAGSVGYDGLMTIRPDGRLYVQSGVGQPRHALGDRSRAGGRRCAGHALGEGRGRVGQHGQGPAVDVHVGRQPDDARDDARQPRRRDGCEAQAAGDRRAGSRRRARRLRAGQRARATGRDSPARGADLRAGRARAPSRLAASSTATSCPTTSTR